MTLLPPRLFQKCLRGINNYLYLKHECSIRFFLQNLPVFEELQSLLSSRPVTDDHKRRAIELLLQAGGWYQMALEAPNPEAVFLQDEGFCHRAISLFATPHGKVADPAVIEEYLDIAPRSHAVIRIEADRADCVRRLHGRRRLPQRLAGASQHEVETFVARACDVIDIATTALDRAGTLVFTIRNTEEPFCQARITAQLDGFVKAFHEYLCCEVEQKVTEPAGVGGPVQPFGPTLANRRR
jgi:hypothetical protein